MKLTIFNVYVPMQDQAQCDRIKQVCIDNGLPIWDFLDSFEYDKNFKHNFFNFGNAGKKFIISKLNRLNHFADRPQVTETEFLTLLNEWKKENGK